LDEQRKYAFYKYSDRSFLLLPYPDGCRFIARLPL
jgi:hypothetical protein